MVALITYSILDMIFMEQWNATFWNSWPLWFVSMADDTKFRSSSLFTPHMYVTISIGVAEVVNSLELIKMPNVCSICLGLIKVLCECVEIIE